MPPAIVGARLKSKRGKGDLVGIQRCLQRNQRSGRHRRDPMMSTADQVRREASGDDLHSALGRPSAKDAVAPLTASKAMAKKPGKSEARLFSAERAAASQVEGHFRALPENSVVDAFLAMSPDRVLNGQVRDFIRNGEDASALEVLNQIVASGVHVGIRTQDTRDSRESRRRRYRPRRDEDRDRRRDDHRDHRGDESLDRDRDRRRDDRRRAERDRDRDRARGGRDRRRREDSR